MNPILAVIYVASAITLLTLFILDLKEQDRLCVGDVLLMVVIVFTPILNTIVILGLALEYLDIQWEELLDKEIWRRK